MTEARHLEPLLAAGSVAVVGASTRIGSVGNTVVRQLAAGDYGGGVFPINPRYETVEGLPCLPNLEALQEAPDLVVLAVPDEQLAEQTTSALTVGAKSLAVFGLARHGAEAALLAASREEHIPLCGPNGMGFVNLDASLRVTGYHQPTELKRGGVAFLSHSGSLFSAMLHNRRGLRFNLVVSTGSELGVTMDEYLEYALDQPTTRVVALFLETIRHSERMAAALDRAEAMGIPVVALPVGRTNRARLSIMTHSQAMAGDGAIAEAYLRHHGVCVVHQLDELADTIDLLFYHRVARPAGLGAVLDSGGERSLLLDLAADVGVELAAVTATTSQTLQAVLESGFAADNPVDAWSTGREFERAFVTSLTALSDDPHIGAVALAVDLTAEETDDPGYGETLRRAAQAATKPLVVLAHLSSAVDPRQAGLVGELDIPVLRGTRSGLVAIRELFWRSRDKLPSPSASSAQHIDLPANATITGSDVLSIIESIGVPVAPHRTVRTIEEAHTTASGFGYPVALKLAHAAHRTEVDGVRLELSSHHEVAAAWVELEHHGEEMLVQPMIRGGVELAVGGLVDPVYGPAVVVGAGGIWAELLDDHSVMMAPVSEAEADGMLRSLKVAPRLLGLRGHQGVDLVAAARAVAALSEFVWAGRSVLEAIDVNPLIVAAHGCWAVDALITTSS